jgi:hypothetical protein
MSSSASSSAEMPRYWRRGTGLELHAAGSCPCMLRQGVPFLYSGQELFSCWTQRLLETNCRCSLALTILYSQMTNYHSSWPITVRRSQWLTLLRIREVSGSNLGSVSPGEFRGDTLN